MTTQMVTWQLFEDQLSQYGLKQDGDCLEGGEFFARFYTSFEAKRGQVKEPDRYVSIMEKCFYVHIFKRLCVGSYNMTDQELDFHCIDETTSTLSCYEGYRFRLRPNGKNYRVIVYRPVQTQMQKSHPSRPGTERSQAELQQV